MDFDATNLKLHDLLRSTEQFSVPKYQRSYEWTIDNAQEFWEDLNSDKQFYLGSFVFSEKSKNLYDIVDGQQRLTTTILFFSAIRAILLENNLSDEAGQVFSSYIMLSGGIGTKIQKPKLLVNESFTSFFEEYIYNVAFKGEISSKSIDRNEKKLRDVYNFFHKTVIEKLDVDMVNSPEEIQAYFGELINKLIESIIIQIKVKSDEEAYRIFESMNSRGVDLSTADLLKNYILSTVDRGSEDETLLKWKEMEMCIKESELKKFNLSKFIRYYWLSKYDFVTEKNLYNSIKSQKIASVELINNLNKSAKLFKMFGSSSKEDWVEEFSSTGIKLPKIISSMRALRLFETTQCFVLFLTLVENKEKINFDFGYVFEAIESYHFMYSAVAKLPGNKVEKLYQRTSENINKILQGNSSDDKDVSKRIQSSLSDLIRGLDKLKPNFETFSEQFRDNVTYDNRQIIRYVYGKIEKYLILESKSGVSEIDFYSSSEYNIEHILPVEPEKWGYNKKDTKEFTDLFGNLIIVDKGINSRMQNFKLEEKIEILDKSPLIIVKTFLHALKNKEGLIWDKDSINDRQNDLTKLLYDKVFKIIK